ncbi:katanin p80 WD40 repeat-containing subunit B1-like isoform X2 [Babylonia areolata]|uniref:katanin p80 WD40 repeat-containing subunit B1-like isoform X2 n=1 Tax=Babylonia areolata TaxID=304850 RepID=UPI003FD4ACE3
MAAANTKRAWKLQDLTAHGSEVTCVGMGRKTGRVMVTGGQDRKVNVWSVGKDHCIMSLTGHAAVVEAVRLGKDEELVIAGSQSGVLKLWDLEQAKILRTLTGHKAGIHCVAFHPYGDYTASGSMDCNVKLWDVRRKGCIYTYKGHTGCVRCLRFSPDGRWIASTADDGLVKLWDLTAGKALTDLTQHKGAVTCVEFHPHEMLLASAGADRTVKFWDLETFKLVCSTDEEPSPVRCIAFHPEGTCLYSGGKDRLKVYGWEPARCYDTVPVDWGNVGDVSVCDNQLIGASLRQTNVSCFVVDLEKTRPLGGGEGEGDGGSHPPHIPPLCGSRKSFTTEKAGSEPLQREEPVDKGEEGEEVSGAHIHNAEEFRHLFQLNNAHKGQAGPRKVERFQPPADDGNRGGDPHPAPHQAPPPVRAEDFLPQAAATPAAGSRSATEVEQQEQFVKGHNPMMVVLTARNHNLQIVRAMWTSGNTKTAVDTAISMKDPAILVDLLSVLNLKTTLWTLDMCISLLPHLKDLLISKYDSYVETAGKAVKLITRNFGPTIKSNMAPAHAHGVDISREERQWKCRQCHKVLTDIRSVVERRREACPRLGSLFKELLILLSTLG